jgi:hypothetical protein
LPKKVKQFATIGSFEEFISRRFQTLVISHCKTQNVEGALFSQAMVDFLMSRVKAGGKVIVIGKQASLNEAWKSTFLVKGTEVIER